MTRACGLRNSEPSAEFVARRLREVLNCARAQFGREVGGVEVGRAFGTLSSYHAEDALGPILNGGKDGGVGGDTLADQRARTNNTFDGLPHGGTGAHIPD
jgi:hypothetical protein